MEIKNLSFAYKDEPEKNILENINLTVEQGEFVCLWGRAAAEKVPFFAFWRGWKPPDREKFWRMARPFREPVWTDP